MESDSRSILNARRKFWRAVQSGKIIPPEICEKCGKKPKQRKDGRRAIHGHHHNGYDKDHIFDVIWLCPSCHKLCHGNTKWTEESKAKMIASVSGPRDLTEEQRKGYAERCLEVRPWETRWDGKTKCPAGHEDNFGVNNRGHRFCRTCANTRRRKTGVV